MKRMSERILATALFSSAVLLASPLGAQVSDPDQAQPLTVEQAEALYEELYRAFHTARICRELQDETLNERVTGVISQLTENKVLIGRQLSLIDEAKRKAKQAVKRSGCEGPGPSESLGIYDARIAPLL